jgi:hypothetical protein
MANKVVIKRTSVVGREPLATDIDVGELAVNLADKKLFTKDGSGTVIQLGGGSGTGDVVGPTSSIDNAIARFDSTTGKLIQNSQVTIDDNGNTANVNSLTFDTTPATLPTTQGSMFWDSGNLTPTVVLNANTDLQLGQENIALVYNGTGSTITAGSVVAVSGAQGQRPSVSLADADSEALSAPTLGIATESIANGAEGFVTTFGFVRGINTSGFTAGAPIYLSQTAGQFTSTRPSAPAHTVALGWVIKVNASSGEVFVNINNGWEIDELHNILITSASSGNTLIYDATAGVWKNANLTDGTGISITEGAGTITVTNTDLGSSQNIFKNLAVSGQSTIVADSNNDTLTVASGTGVSLTTNATTDTLTITNTAPDQIVSLSGGGTTTVGGTYPNFTISSADQFLGTVTSVSATVPTGLTVSGSPIINSGTLAISYTAGYAIPTTAKQTEWDTAFTDRNKWDGGATGLVASTGRTSLGGTTLGSNIFTITNPSAITFPRFNADNTISALSATDFRTAIGAGTGNGTVTSVGGTGTVNGLTLTGTVTSTGSLTLGGSLSGVSLTTQVTGTLPFANGGTGATTRQEAIDALAGAVTSGQYLRGNGTDVVMSTIQASDVPTLNQNTTGTASNVTGTVAIANGGTGSTTAANARTALSAQETLVSGTNIKTINGNSVLGSGNLTVSAAIVYQ